MSVYIDEPFRIWRGIRYSQMAAPLNSRKIHRIASAIGLRRDWAETCDGYIYYNVIEQLRDDAIKEGAIPVTNERMMEALNAAR